MDVSVEPVVPEPSAARLVAPLARLGANGESLLLTIASAGRDQGAALARASTELSPLSMLLGRLASTDPGDAPAAAAPLTELPASARDTAQSLQKSIAQSGLFYESHLARWAEGRHALEELRLEPQARASRDHGTPDTAPGQPPASPVAEELAPMVRRQLELIENPTLVWRGDVWPGQAASLEIRPEQGGQGEAGSEAPAWTTRLRMELPQLGGIDALLTLRGNSVAISFGAADAIAAQRLNGARADLDAALHAKGVAMERFSVNADVPR